MSILIPTSGRCLRFQQKHGDLRILIISDDASGSWH